MHVGRTTAVRDQNPDPRKRRALRSYMTCRITIRQAADHSGEDTTPVSGPGPGPGPEELVVTRARGATSTRSKLRPRPGCSCSTPTACPGRLMTSRRSGSNSSTTLAPHSSNARATPAIRSPDTPRGLNSIPNRSRHSDLSSGWSHYPCSRPLCDSLPLSYTHGYEPSRSRRGPSSSAMRGVEPSDLSPQSHAPLR